MEEALEEPMNVSGQTLDKVAEVLVLTRQPTLKYRIKSICGLPGKSSTFLFLKWLVDAHLVSTYPVFDTRSWHKFRGTGSRYRPKPNHQAYKTSEKGLVFLKMYNELLVWHAWIHEPIYPKHLRS